MNPPTISTAVKYRRALARCAELMALDPACDSPEGVELCELACAVEAYEKIRYPFRVPSAAELAAFRRAERGASRHD